MRRLSARRSLFVGSATAVAAMSILVVITACGSSHETTVKTGSAGATSAASRQRAAAQAVRSARTEVAAAAAYLGVSVAQLHRELRGGKSLAAVAKSTRGRTEAGLIAALERQRVKGASKGLEQPVVSQVQTPGGRLLAPLFSLREDAREYLGLTLAQLRDRERGGKSLAQVARTVPGRSEAGMIDAIFNTRKRQLEAAVKTGRLRADVERLSLSGLRRRVQVYVTRPAGGESSQGSR